MILFNLSGHGHFDLGAYDQFLAGKLEDFEYPREAVEASMAKLPRGESLQSPRNGLGGVA